MCSFLGDSVAAEDPRDKYIDVPTIKQNAVDHFTIVGDEDLAAPVDPVDEYVAENSDSPEVHRPWWRDPIIVFGWLLPLYILAGFLIWLAIDLSTNRVRMSQRAAVAGERLVQEPVGLKSEATAKAKTELADSEKSPPAPAVLPELPASPVVAGPTEDEVTAADVPEVDEPADDDGFDLRGPVPAIGFRVRERVAVHGVRSDDFHRSNATYATLKTDITRIVENVYTVTAVANDEVTEYTMEVVAGHETSSFVGFDRRRRTDEKLDDLVEQTITSRRLGGDWVHIIRDHAPDEKEQIALLRLAAWFADRESFPSKKQHVGSSWAINKAHVRKLLGGEIGAVSGTVEAKFVRLDEINNEKVAVIDYKGSIRGRFDFSDPPDIIGAIDVDLTSSRSLATGVDTTWSGSLKIRSDHQTDINGPVDVSEVISMTIRSSAKVDSQE